MPKIVSPLKIVGICLSCATVASTVVGVSISQSPISYYVETNLVSFLKVGNNFRNARLYFPETTYQTPYDTTSDYEWNYDCEDGGQLYPEYICIEYAQASSNAWPLIISIENFNQSGQPMLDIVNPTTHKYMIREFEFGPFDIIVKSINDHGLIDVNLSMIKVKYDIRYNKNT